MCNNQKVSLRAYSTDDLIKWRNAASIRTDSHRDEISKSVRKINRINKKIQSDIIWIRKLNKIIYQRAHNKSL